jgi:hypothetical protein
MRSWYTSIKSSLVMHEEGDGGDAGPASKEAIFMRMGRKRMIQLLEVILEIHVLYAMNTGIQTGQIVQYVLAWPIC